MRERERKEKKLNHGENNLNCKNPHEVAIQHGDHDELMQEYQAIVCRLEAAQQALKAELMQALGGN